MPGADGDRPESPYLVMETSPPDYVEKISRYLDSVERNKHDGESNGPDGGDSDSGDSLFITQKEIPEAVRSRRLHHYNPESPKQVKGGKSIRSKWKEPRKKRRKHSYPFSRDHLSCMMGGFFKCISELKQHHEEGRDLRSSLPTLDMEDITPLSEEEEEKAEDEDIKVVAKRCLVVLTKATKQQSWLSKSINQRTKTANTKRRRQTLHVKPAMLKVIPIASDTESSDDGESSSNVLGHGRRTRATTGMQTRSANRRLTQRHRKVLPLQSSSEESSSTISDAVCEEPKLRRRLRLNPRKGSVASTSVPPPAGDRLGHQHISHTLPDIVSDIREKKQKASPQGPRADAYVEESLFEENRADSPAAQTTDELEGQGKNRMVDSAFDSNELRQEEGHVPGGKQKKKKRKKKSEAENDGHDVNGNLESDVRSEDLVYAERCDVEDSGKRMRSAEDTDQTPFIAVFKPLNDEAEMKKKKKRSAEDADQPQFTAVFKPLNDETEMKKRSAEDIEQPVFTAVFKPLNDEAEIKKKKKKKRKKEGIVITEEREEEEATSRTLDPPAVSTEQSEESGHYVENAAAAQETKSERKKRKKKQKLSSHDAHGDVSVCFDDSVITDQCAGVSLQKKLETVSEGLETKEAPEDQNTELVKKKKKEKKRRSSFLTADAEEIHAHTHVEQNHHSPSDVWVAEKLEVSAADEEDCVLKQKKKRKRKMLMVQEDDHEQDFESNMEMKKKHTGSESKSPTTTERLESAADADVSDKKRKKCKEGTGIAVEEAEASSETAGDQPLNYMMDKKKKKKKKKCKEGTGNEVEDVEASSETAGDQPLNDIMDKKKKKKKCKEGPGNTVEDAEASSETAGDQPLNDVVDKKKKKKKKKCKEGTGNMVEDAEAGIPRDQILNDTSDDKKIQKIKSTDDVSLVGELVTDFAELEPKRKKKKHKEKSEQSAEPSITSSSPVTPNTSLPESIMSPSGTAMKTKQKKIKRRLLDPSADFLWQLT